MNDIHTALQWLIDNVWLGVGNLASVWSLYQALIVAACFVAALAVTRPLQPVIERRLRQIESQPRLLRFLAVLLRRAHWIAFAVLLWSAVLVMRPLTWPSHRYFVELVASLASAWVVVGVLSRVIRKRSLARFVEVGAWSIAALYMSGKLEATIALLDWLAISFGDVRISLLTVLKGIGTFAALLWLGSVIGDLVERRLRDTDLMNPSLKALLSKLAKAALITVAVIVSLSAAGIDVTLLTVFSGAVGLGIGFGLQKVASNLASGVIMLADRSVKPGDVIQLGTTFGWITSLKARYVSVVTRDGAEYLIPNEQFITERVVNWSYTDRKVRLEIKFGVSYASDPHLVRSVVVETISMLDRVHRDPEPVCHLVGFGDSSLDFVARFWIDDPEQGMTNIRSSAYFAVWDAFKANGIGIPYPHREVIVHARAASGEPGPAVSLPAGATQPGQR